MQAAHLDLIERVQDGGDQPANLFVSLNPLDHRPEQVSSPQHIDK